MTLETSAAVGDDIPLDESITTGEIRSKPSTKSAIIDQELNRHGMGRYQWLIWTICGTGFFLDVMWGQAFGLAWPSMQREFGFSDKGFGEVTVAFTAGMASGAFMWGVLVDVVGRRVAFLGTSLIAGMFGLCLGAQTSFDGLLVVLAFTGVGVGGNIPIDATIVAEYIPEDRFYLLTALCIFQPAGVVLCTFIAFWLIPNYSCSTNLVSCKLTGDVAPCCAKDANMGWRYLFFAMGSITFGIFILRCFVFPFYESPRFLLSKGNDQGAVEVIQKIAAFNKHPCGLTVESLQEKCQESPAVDEADLLKRLVNEITRLKLLFGNWRVTRITIIVWITWMFDACGYSIAAAYLPTILQRKNSAIHITLEQTYIDYFIIYTPSFAAAILAVIMVRVPFVGRKWTLVCSSMAMGMSLFLYSVVNTEANRVGFGFLESFCQLLFNSVLYGWTPEAFPSAVRGTATGLAAFFASLFTISGPLIAAQLFGGANGSNAVLYLAGSGVFVCTLALLCIPAKDMVAPR